MASVSVSNYTRGYNPYFSLHNRQGSRVDSVSAAISVEPPFSQIGEALYDAVLGRDPFGINLELVATDDSESVFVAEAAFDEVGKLEQKIGDLGIRLERLRGSLSAGAEMARENPFPNPFATETISGFIPKC